MLIGNGIVGIAYVEHATGKLKRKGKGDWVIVARVNKGEKKAEAILHILPECNKKNCNCIFNQN